MNKDLKIKKAIKELEQQKLEAEQLVKATTESINQRNLELAQYYQDFFMNKRNKEFVLYDRFPSAEVLKLYTRKISSEFPLYECGDLNVKELAEIIKQLYQFKRGKEYDILTIGANEHRGTPVYGEQSFSILAHLYFLVGTNNTLEPFREYNGKYINEDKIYLTMCLHAKGKDLISVELESGNNVPVIDIECLTGSYEDVPGKINYYNCVRNVHLPYEFSKEKNMFEYYQLGNRVLQKGPFGYNGIKDVMSFPLHSVDTFIAKILISICVYKRNNNIKDLSSEDYNHIFDVLYGEKVDIINQADKDIPKQLQYIPNSEIGR